MRPMIAWGVMACSLAAAIGCTQASYTQKPADERVEESTHHAPAHYTQKLEDEGIVAISDNSTENRAQAIKLIEQHVGAEYQILSEAEVVKGLESELENLSTETSPKEYQIHYWKLGVWRRGANSLPALSLPVAGLGCVDRSEDKGVIAIPNGSKKNRDEAIKLIEVHLGSDYAIVWEGEKETTAKKAIVVRSTKYYIFYRKRSSIGKEPDWQPCWSTEPSGKTYPGWVRGGIL